MKEKKREVGTDEKNENWHEKKEKKLKERIKLIEVES